MSQMYDQLFLTLYKTGKHSLPPLH